MENWLDFIDYLLFGVQVKSKEFKDNCLRIDLGCGISFHVYLSDDALLINDILYWSDKSIMESEEFGFYIKGGGVFSEQNKEIVKSIFDTPINTGWTDYNYYYDSELRKVVRYEGINSAMAEKSYCSFRVKNLPPEYFIRKLLGLKTSDIKKIIIEPAIIWKDNN